MAEGKKRINVSAAVMQKDGKFFVAQRRADKDFGGYWEFPGGKWEPGETPEECLARELREEFEIETEITDFLLENTHDYGSVEVRMMTYGVKHLSGEFKLSEHDDARWLELSEFDEYEFCPADYPIIEHLKSCL